MKRNIHLISIYAGGFFLFIDQLLKYFARTHPMFTYYLDTRWLGWEYFANTGIAFSIPLPSFITILITPLVLLALFIAWNTRVDKTPRFYFGATLIIAGAVSNFIDRILFNATIDYLRILTGVINLADVMVVGGGVLLFFNKQKAKTKEQ